MNRVLFVVIILASLLFTSCLSLLSSLVYDSDGGISRDNGNSSISAYPDGTTKINEGEHQRTPN